MSSDQVSRRGLLRGGAVALATNPLLAQANAATPPAISPKEGSAMIPVELTVNGREVHLQLDPRTSLLDALREHLHLTGTKKGCDHGQCGACTVLVDGVRMNSCLKLAVSVQNEEITTIEGLGTPENMHPMQKAFVEHDAYQCGYCTPGQICSAVGMLMEGHVHTREEIRELMSGNLCRCGAYTNIADAIEQVMGADAAKVWKEAAE